MNVVWMRFSDAQESDFRFIQAPLTPQSPGALEIRQVAMFKRRGSSRHGPLISLAARDAAKGSS
jgi:hypothetical protein